VANSLQTVGAQLQRGAFPTRHITDILEISGKNIEVSICDIAILCVFVRPSDLGISGTESATAITNDKDFILRYKELRGKAAHMLGMCKDWKRVDEQSPGVPLIVMINPVSDPNVDAHINSRLMLNNTCHDSMAGTGAMCIAGCSRIRGSLVHTVVGERALGEGVLKILHPLGVLPAWVEQATDGNESSKVAVNNVKFNVLAFVRTSRRLMDGGLFIPDDIWSGFDRGIKCKF
jgi:2-methylaconitate cis-trans-isomerase PrpF